MVFVTKQLFLRIVWGANCPDTGQRVKQPLKLPYFKMINSDYDCNDTNHNKKNNKNYNNDNANISLTVF